MYLIFNTILNLIFWNIFMFINKVISFPEIIGISTGILIGLITPFYRLIIFEYIYNKQNYISKRQMKVVNFYDLPKELCSFTNILTYSVVGYFLLSKPYDYRIITVFDVCLCVTCFFITDIFFYCTHRLNHLPIFYSSLGHKEHHKLVKPTSYELIENFTLADGLSHILAFCLSIIVLSQFTSIDNYQYILMFSQWVLVGELQHGGKDIEIDSIPFVEHIRKLFINQNMCLIHDTHHSIYNKQYSLTGIPDKVLGTYYTAPYLIRPSPKSGAERENQNGL